VSGGIVVLTDLSILWVDDDTEFVELLARRFKRRGARVRICGSAEACLEAVRHEPPNIVVTDRMLAGYDGLRLVSRMREESPDLVVIMLSGHSDDASIQAAMNAGATEYLAKPVPLAQLEEVIVRCSLGDGARLTSHEVRL
jgi:two-component system C4-dicarboxylate transport response regulator DctD